MSKLAVIGTFYQRRERTEMLMNRILVESTRPPDEFWMMCEEDEDAAVGIDWLNKKELSSSVHIQILPTPSVDGKYSVIPYSNKINWALDYVTSDYVVFLDNGSTPHIRKYELMVQALDKHPEWGAVYCSQQRTGFRGDLALADQIVHDAYNVLNYTQVMYRKTEDRWVLDMKWADPDIADALFWRDLHKILGPFYPVPYHETLDEHHLPSAKAAGV